MGDEYQYLPRQYQHVHGDCGLFNHNYGWKPANCAEYHYFVCDYVAGNHNRNTYCKKYLICDTQVETTNLYQTYCPGIFIEKECITTPLTVQTSQAGWVY